MVCPAVTEKPSFKNWLVAGVYSLRILAGIIHIALVINRIACRVRFYLPSLVPPQFYGRCKVEKCRYCETGGRDDQNAMEGEEEFEWK
ncbi:hypothetical protein PsAD37_02127 [Pseudovibrio sp. Ad37]|nr:hypothetical protein PsAD37_02127 [Pseudovibrio sp. Ad37]